MPEPNGEATGTDTNDGARKATPITRRRWLKLAAAGVVAGGVATGRAAAGADDHPNTIVFDGTVSRGKSKYEFTVSGSVHAHGDVGAIEVNDTVDGSSVAGAVHRDKDAYRFSGSLTGLDLKGDAAVSLTYGDENDVAADRLEIVAGTDASVDYSFTASDRITPVRDRDENPAESDDTVAENDDGSWTATGSTDSGTGDTFDFWGDVTDFAPMDGDYTLFLNGNELTAYDLTGEEPPSDTDTTTHTLEITTPTDGSVEYTMTTTGEIRKVTDNGDLSSEDNDTVTQNDDGTWTATGLTGNGYGDTLEFDGEAVEFSPMEGTYTLYLDGTEVTAAELVGQERTSKTLEIVTPEDGSIEYTFTTTGELSKVLDNGKNSSEDNDTVTQNDDGTWTATGLTGNGYGDTYEFYGDVTAFDPKEGTFALYVDGTQVTAYELTDTESADDSTSDDSTSDDSTSDDSTSDDSTSDGSTTDTSGGSTDGSVLGGGKGYANTVSRDSADIEATTAAELEDALAAAVSGDVVYVPGNVEMDLGGGNIDVPGGVTVASNRGIDDAPGALLYTDGEPDECLNLYGTARLTGVRLKGPHPGDDTSGDGGADGVGVYDDGEVDNCDIWGFSHGGVKVEGGGRPEPHIHHNVIREINRGGYGYGVSVIEGNPLIEYNYFNFNRHSVAATGYNYGYVARYNHFGPELTDTQIDVHGGGDGGAAAVNTEVYDNVVEGYVPTIGRFEDTTHQCAQVRGVPEDVADLHDNWFWNPREPEPGTWAGYAIIQPDSSDWQNVTFSGNYYGETANVSFSDVIPGYDGWRSP